MLTDHHVHLRRDDPNTPASEATSRRQRRALPRGRRGARDHRARRRRAHLPLHQSLDVWDHPFWRAEARDDLDDYIGFLREETDLRAGHRGGLRLRSRGPLANLLEARDWDYVVGSVHFLGDQAVDHDGYDIWETNAQRPDEVWRRYFETLGEAARDGHVRHPRPPGPREGLGRASARTPTGDLRRFYDRAMEGIAETQLGDRGVHRRAAQAGRRAVPGACRSWRCASTRGARSRSPATPTSPRTSATATSKALEVLDSLGVRELAVFERRERRLEPIG